MISPDTTIRGGTIPELHSIVAAMSFGVGEPQPPIQYSSPAEVGNGVRRCQPTLYACVRAGNVAPGSRFRALPTCSPTPNDIVPQFLISKIEEQALGRFAAAIAGGPGKISW